MLRVWMHRGWPIKRVVLQACVSRWVSCCHSSAINWRNLR